ncbi:MAG: GNAT family N-acetyltransferase [Ignavibacteriae bacterium]|nr:MAG: GNAT family N-acetyltransferase [Ignavibacteriota bacterium]
MNIKITKAKKEDKHAVLSLIYELADFEKLTPPDKKSQQRILKDAFGIKPLFNILLAKENGRPVGYAFYFYTYSSFLARKTLYLEDVFISQDYRSKGIGKMFMNKLMDIAKKNKCGRMEWCVLDWNKNAIDFYEHLGAKHLKEWLYYRITF